MGCIYKQKDLELRPFDSFNGDDLIKYKEWMTDSEVTKFNSHGLFNKTHFEIEDFIDEAIHSKKQITWKLYFEDNFIGMCSLQSIDLINRSGEVAIYIGEKSLWGKGFAQIAICFMIDHGFKRLGLHRIWSGTAETNTGMNKVFNRIGFSEDGRFRDGAFLNGEFVDIISYSILHDELD